MKFRLPVQRFQQYVKWQSQVICVSRLLCIWIVCSATEAPRYLSPGSVHQLSELAGCSCISEGNFGKFCFACLIMPCLCPQDDEKYFALIDEDKWHSTKLASCSLHTRLLLPGQHRSTTPFLNQIMLVIILSWAYSCWHGYWQRLSQYFNKKTKYRKYSRVSRWIINKTPWRAETASQHRECITVRHTT